MVSVTTGVSVSVVSTPRRREYLRLGIAKERLEVAAKVVHTRHNCLCSPMCELLCLCLILALCYFRESFCDPNYVM